MSGAKGRKPNGGDSLKRGGALRCATPAGVFDGLLSTFSQDGSGLDGTLGAMLLTEAIEENPSEIVVLDAEGRNLYLNGVARRRLGVAKGDYEGKSLWEMFPKDIADAKFEDISEVVRTGRPLNREVETADIEGRRGTWLHSALRPLKDASGRVAAVLALARDISERKESAKALRRERNRLKTILDGIPDVVGLQLSDHTIISYNKAGYEFLGKPPSEVDGRKCYELIGRQSPCEPCATSLAIKAGRPQSIQRRSPIDGRWLEVRTVPIFDEQGGLREIVELIRDISELKRKEEELFDREKERYAILDGMKGLFVSYLAPDMSVIWANRTMCDMAPGMLANDVKGRLCHELFHGLASVCPGCCAPLALSTGVMQENEMDTVEGRSILVRNTPVKDAAGKVKGIVHVAIDISERKAMEESLRHEKERAEASSRSKGEFLACISHELRTPLNAIIGMTDILKASGGGDPVELVECCDAIRQASEELMSVVGEILDYSSLECDSVRIVSLPFDLKRELDPVGVFMGKQAEAKGLEFRLDIDRGIPELMEGDPHHVRQVVVNLLGNAIKFTERGHVALSASAERVEEDALELSLVVEDSGVGIAKDALERVFDPFVQEDSSTQRAYGGAGLGLSIARNLVRLMGGTISVESEKWKGAKFTVRLPFKLPSGP